MSQAAAQFEKPNFIDRMFNRVFGCLVGHGLGPPHNYLLQVRGRKSGRVYSTPVDVLMHGGALYLVAGRGYTQWVRNAQASGLVTLKKGATREEFQVRAVPDADKPTVLKAYLDRFKRTVQRYFPLPAGSPAKDFAPLAERYPVFELVPVAENSTAA